MTRLSVVGLVLALGVGSAMLFRKEQREPVDGVQTTPDALLLRKSPSSVSPPKATVVTAADNSTGKPTTDVSVLRRTQIGESTKPKALPPPDLENTFARPFTPPSPNTTAMQPERPEDEVAEPLSTTVDGIAQLAESRDKPETRVRIVVDGDSLRSLAKRYLGDSDRYMEIYEANRDVLTSPDLLVIGMKLKIPAKPSETSVEPVPPTKPKMVPIK